MAARRMLSKSVTNSSKFLMMPLSSQALYMHLNQNSDDDGYCEYFGVVRMCGAQPDDLKVLAVKGFVIVFDDLVLIIKDWKESNYVRRDTYTPSKYLSIYPIESSTARQLDVDETSTQDRSGKDSLNNTNKSPSEKPVKNKNWKPEYSERYILAFNELFGKSYKITKQREEKLKLRLTKFTIQEIAKALDNLASSKFHRGDNDRGWCADPDFLIRSDEQVDKFLNFKGGDK